MAIGRGVYLLLTLFAQLMGMLYMNMDHLSLANCPGWKHHTLHLLIVLPCLFSPDGLGVYVLFFWNILYLSGCRRTTFLGILLSKHTFFIECSQTLNSIWVVAFCKVFYLLLFFFLSLLLYELFNRIHIIVNVLN